MTLTLRAEFPIASLTFFTALDGKVLAEACRVNMTTSHLQGIADVICRVTDHYPTKAAVAPKKKKR